MVGCCSRGPPLMRANERVFESCLVCCIHCYMRVVMRQHTVQTYASGGRSGQCVFLQNRRRHKILSVLRMLWRSLGLWCFNEHTTSMQVNNSNHLVFTRFTRHAIIDNRFTKIAISQLCWQSNTLLFELCQQEI